MKQKNKLVKKQEFQAVFNFNKRIYTKNIICNYKPNNFQTPRFGFIISKKNFKRAVDRNYIKRLLKATIDETYIESQSLDFVILVKQDFLTSYNSFTNLKKEFKFIFEKLMKREKNATFNQ